MQVYFFKRVCIVSSLLAQTAKLTFFGGDCEFSWSCHLDLQEQMVIMRIDKVSLLVALDTQCLDSSGQKFMNIIKQVPLLL